LPYSTTALHIRARIGQDRTVSGILALVRTDGAPVEPGLVRGLTKLLTVKGPDRENVWCNGQAALGHTLLRTGRPPDQQPFTIDGVTWIVADARVDERDDLASQLGPIAEEASASASDAELILRAYLKWGERCVDYLLGDYAFAVWDGRERRLFFARDHIGVKPLYFASVGPWLLVSNAIECLRGHRAISNQLDDRAIADFLLFGFNQDPAATAFRDIRRLPAAHAGSWSTAGLAVRRYWTMPIEDPVYYARDREYTDQFLELLRRAVADRLPAAGVGIFMSGGIDSPALATTAVDLLGGPSADDPVCAFTIVHESLIPDSDRQYAAMTAAHLRIPINYYVADAAPGWPRSSGTETPEPFAGIFGRDPELRCYVEMAAHSRVAFYGEGPDNALLYEWRPYLSHLMNQRRWARLVTDAGQFLLHHRRVPLLTTLPHLMGARLDPATGPVFPKWMDEELVRRHDLKDRWHDAHLPLRSAHPVRPVAYASFHSPLWQSVFETLEPSYTGSPLEVRHPYVDIRLLRFLMRVPVIPWCRNKHLVRCALRGILPEAVRRRRKRPLSGSPDYERALRHGLPAPRPSERLSHYGAPVHASVSSGGTVGEIEANLRFVALSHWLYALDAARDPQTQER
jgi:asparagine synthase (glutamine-hydrolysing)